MLKAPPGRIDIKFLEQYPEFIEFRRPKAAGEEAAVRTVAVDTETPEEALEAAHAKMTASLASDLLAHVKAGSSEFFEKLVVELLLKMGYGGSRADAGQAVGKAGDEGIDGVISEDRLGLDVVTFRPLGRPRRPPASLLRASDRRAPEYTGLRIRVPERDGRERTSRSTWSAARNARRPGAGLSCPGALHQGATWFRILCVRRTSHPAGDHGASRRGN